jgi:polysaccharide chain length determinant protein (PEP-CTERM system associated)
MEPEVKTIQDFLAILRRRKKALCVPAVIVFVLAAAVAFLLPSIYRSTATILIEEQEIPREYVMSMVTSYAEQRIQSSTQRIMSAARLIEIINRFNLYPDLRAKWTMEEVIAKMRKDIKFETISADVVDRRTGRPTAATIAFTVSYEGKNPQVVLQVANVLSSLYLEENIRVRDEKTAGASKFIEEEMKDVQAALAKQDAKIAEYKQRHINTLPELNQMNMQELERLERSLEQAEIQLRGLRERESFIKTQMASIPQDLASPDKERLKELRVRLISLKTRYSDQYPDVIKTRTEIAELEKKLGAPDAGAIGDKPDNPAYINLASQLSGTRSEIESLDKQIKVIQRKRDEYKRRMEAAPGVEEGYKILISERNNLQVKYDDLMKKHMETKVATGMEKGQLGERFTLIDPPRMPEKPVRPNIPAILLIGLVLGIGSGVGAASLREFSDQSVRSGEALSRATGFPVLASIPEFLNQEDLARIRRRRLAWIFSAAMAIVVGVVVFHFFIMDLDVFWAKLDRRLTIF